MNARTGVRRAMLTSKWGRVSCLSAADRCRDPWLLLVKPEADPLTAQLADALNAVGAQSTSVASASDVAQLRSLLRQAHPVLSLMTANGWFDCSAARDYVTAGGIARELAGCPVAAGCSW